MSRNSRRQNSDLADEFVKIGEIVKPHGIRGELKVYTYSEQPENFKLYKYILLQEAAGSLTAIYNVVNSRARGKMAILQLKGVVTREAAEALQGSTVWLKKTEFPKLNSDEYYWHQCIGLQVWTESGCDLGNVTGLFTTKAHDVMVVTGTGHEYMIPLTGDIIKNIDVQGKKVLIAPPPGLLEANEED